MADGRGSYRVRIAGQEILFPDLDTIRRLVDEGQIGASAEVRAPGSERWLPLAAALADRRAQPNPWEVWAEADTVDPGEVWKEFAPRARAPDEPMELPQAALTPVEEERPRSPADRAGPKLVIDASKRTTGKVLAFPARAAERPPRTEGSQALAPDDTPEPVPLRPPPPPRPAPIVVPPRQARPSVVRWGRVAGLLLAGVAALLFARWYVVGQPEEALRRPPAAQTQTTPSLATPAQPSSSSPAPTEEPYGALESRLRGLLLTDVREVNTEEQIEDALHVELSAVRLNVIRVDASVLGWTGRKRDVPRIVELRIDLRSEVGDIDYDLGGVGMVVGKYVQRFGYEMPRLEVVFEGIAPTPQRMSLDPEASRQLYLGHKSLLDYLRTRPG